jgi:hypothetical protein
MASRGLIPPLVVQDLADLAAAALDAEVFEHEVSKLGTNVHTRAVPFYYQQSSGTDLGTQAHVLSTLADLADHLAIDVLSVRLRSAATYAAATVAVLRCLAGGRPVRHDAIRDVYARVDDWRYLGDVLLPPVPAESLDVRRAHAGVGTLLTGTIDAAEKRQNTHLAPITDLADILESGDDGGFETKSCIQPLHDLGTACHTEILRRFCGDGDIGAAARRPRR